MEELVSQELACTQCQALIKEEQKFCPGCGFPQRGTAGDKAKYHAEQSMARGKSREAPKLIKQARNTLFFVAGLTFLYGIIIFFAQDDTATLIAAAIMTGIYLLLGFWSQQKPLIALVLGLFLYLTNIVLSAIIEPETIYQGIIVKIIVIAFLAKGINSALHLRKAK
jgi:hypothetical protein